MALKPHRDINQYDTSYFMNTTATRGGVVVYSTVGSGDALDQAAAVVAYAAAPSGSLPVGLLLNDVVNLDLTRQHINEHKNEVQQGSKVALMTIGEVETDSIYPGTTVTVNDPAYLGPSGLLTITDTNEHATPWVGVFKSSKDEDGYAKVFINLPAASPRL